MIGSKGEKLQTLLETNRELIRITGADEQIDRENADTAAEVLFSSLRPDADAIGTTLTGVLQAWSRQVPREGKTTLAACLFIVIGVIAVGPTAIARTAIGYLDVPVEVTILAEPFLLTAVGSGILAILGMVGSMAVIFGGGISNWAPNHGDTVSLALTTPGDGTVETSMSLGGMDTSELRKPLEIALPNISLREETTTYGTLLGIDAGDGLDTTGCTPHVVQFRLKSHTPYDALGEGATLADLAAGQDDSGTLVDTLCATLANRDIPALVQTTVTARQRDPGRTDAIRERMKWVHRADPADAAWTDTEAGAEQRTRVFDVNVRLLAFERSDAYTTAPELRKRLEEDLEAVVNNNITGVTHRDFRVDRSPAVSFLNNPGWATLTTTADTLLKRIHTDTTTYTRAYSFWGATSTLEAHTRANFAATSREVGRHLYVTDAGLETSKRATQSQRRDQTPTGRPPEHIQAQFRAEERRLGKPAETTASAVNADDESDSTDTTTPAESDDESPSSSPLAHILSWLRAHLGRLR